MRKSGSRARQLEHPQDMIAHRHRIANILERQGVLFERGIAEEIDRRSRCQDEIVVGDIAALGLHCFLSKIHPIDARHHELEVFLALENRPHRVGNLVRRNAGRRHLVQQRLEQVIIAFVNHRHADRFARQRARRAQAAKPGANNHYMGEYLVHVYLVRYKEGFQSASELDIVCDNYLK